MTLRRLLRTLLLRLAALLDDSSPAPRTAGPPPHWLERVRRAQFVSSEEGPVTPAPAVAREVPRVGVPRVAVAVAVTPREPHVARMRAVERRGEPVRELPVQQRVDPVAERSAGFQPAGRVGAEVAERRGELPVQQGVDPVAGRSAGFQPAGPPASSRRVGAPPEQHRPVFSLRPAVAPGAMVAADPQRSDTRWAELGGTVLMPAGLGGGVPEGGSAGGTALMVEDPAPAGSRRSGRLEAGAPLGGAPLGGAPLGGAPRAGVSLVDDPRATVSSVAGTVWPELPVDGDFVATLDDAEHLRRIDAEQRGAAWSE